MMAAFDALSENASTHGVSASHFAEPGHAYRFGVRPNLAELLTTISGVTFDAAATDARVVEIDGRVR